MKKILMFFFAMLIVSMASNAQIIKQDTSVFSAGQFIKVWKGVASDTSTSAYVGGSYKVWSKIYNTDNIPEKKSLTTRMRITGASTPNATFVISGKQFPEDNFAALGTISYSGTQADTTMYFSTAGYVTDSIVKKYRIFKWSSTQVRSGTITFKDIQWSFTK